MAIKFSFKHSDIVSQGFLCPRDYKQFDSKEMNNFSEINKAVLKEYENMRTMQVFMQNVLQLLQRKPWSNDMKIDNRKY